MFAEHRKRGWGLADGLLLKDQSPDASPSILPPPPPSSRKRQPRFDFSATPAASISHNKTGSGSPLSSSASPISSASAPEQDASRLDEIAYSHSSGSRRSRSSSR